MQVLGFMRKPMKKTVYRGESLLKPFPPLLVVNTPMKYSKDIPIETGDKITLKPFSLEYNHEIGEEVWKVLRSVQPLEVTSEINPRGSVTVLEPGKLNCEWYILTSAINKIIKRKMYGIWDDVDKRFVFGIRRHTSELATEKFRKDYFKVSHMWRYEVKEIPYGFINPPNPTKY